ncbi:MAG TPA: DUF3180 domain-containing protein [Streptosporangiaceae bacterium]|nr:DUF3180 domain-containing protein [Streptosporangiaceae bacterium]
MQPTRPWVLLALAAVIAVLTWLLVRATFSDLPPLPWTAVPALALLAVGEWLTGRNLRERLYGRPGGKPVQPLAIPRLAAFAKASSTAATIFGGLATGLGVYAISSLDKPAFRHDAVAAGATLLAAIALAGAALYLERSCRAPEPPEDDDLPSENGQRGRRP